MRGIIKGPISFIAGEDLTEGMAVHINWATRTVLKAFDEDVEVAIVLNTVNEGDAVSVKRKDLNSTDIAIVKDTGSRGADVYLDTQANQAAATGKLTFTKGTGTDAPQKALFIADGASVLANQYITVARKE
jgi:hypothetical protein